MVEQLLAQEDWSVIYAADVDDYMVRFNKIFKETFGNYTPVLQIFKKHKQHHSNHIMKLIHLKRH